MHSEGVETPEVEVPLMQDDENEEAQESQEANGPSEDNSSS